MRAAKKQLFSFARGFRGRTKNCWTLAQRSVHKAWLYAYVSRRLRKRQYRSEWIMRVNAGARQHGLRYSEMVRYLPSAGIELNRRLLAELAATEPFSFKALVEAAKLQKAAEERSRAEARAAALGASSSGAAGGSRAAELR